MQFSQQERCNKELFPCPTSWAIPKLNGTMCLKNEPHGIVLTGHIAARNRMMIIPKEEFRAFWIASFSIRDEIIWQNKAFLGTPNIIRKKPFACDQPCIIFEDGKFTEEEFTLEDTVKRLAWTWQTKIQIQNSSIVESERHNENGKHIDCGCQDSQISRIAPIRELGTVTVVTNQLARENSIGLRKRE